ncbi:MAG: Copper-exporting ATPase [Erysipelotrichaceae bacterium]|nr:MAG: Copper-exporting [Erysipelotrichaceae bacterium]TXT16252.1 MAG: Copper-exporting ATPase [Erysipelotrichaceae bacterium]
MISKKISIKGMHCSHCAGLINIELYSIKEVMDVKVDIRDQQAIVRLKQDIDNALLIRAVEKAGYMVEFIS